jgi:hypothetical protein
MTTNHSLFSSHREMILEHLFAGEVMRRVWLSGVKRLEILKPQVDDGGYDLVLEANSIMRHIQLKATFKGSKVARFNVHMALAEKPSGCVVVQVFDPLTLKADHYLWFGAESKERLPDISGFAVAKHTKGNSLGKKLERPSTRIIPRSKFVRLNSVEELAERLFGLLPGVGEG